MACDVEYALQENLNMISGAEPFSMPCNFRWVVLRTVLYGNIHTKFVAK